MEFLSGYKTYIVVAVGVVINGLYAMGLVDENFVKSVDGILIFAGMGTIRAGITKSGG